MRLLGADRDINTLTDEQVREYGRQRKDEGAQSGAVVKEMIALRRALGVAKEMGHFAGDPAADRSAFVGEFLRTLEACADLGDFAAIGRLVEDWKATASLHSEGLAGRLKGPLRLERTKVSRP